jgi:hypothetical protein
VWLSAGARTQLAVDLVNMRQEAARGGQKVHVWIQPQRFFYYIQGVRAYYLYNCFFSHLSVISCSFCSRLKIMCVKPMIALVGTDY